MLTTERLIWTAAVRASSQSVVVVLRRTPVLDLK